MVTKTETQTYVYATFIRTTKEKLWEALTNGDFTEQYWMGFRLELEPRAGGRFRMIPAKGGPNKWNDDGKVLACEPGRKLVYEFAIKDAPEVAAKRDGYSRVTYELQPMGDLVRLQVVHENLLPDDIGKDTNTLRGVNNGWPAVMSSLKSLLETGQAIPLESCGGPVKGE